MTRGAKTGPGEGAAPRAAAVTLLGRSPSEFVRPNDRNELTAFLRDTSGPVVPFGGGTRLGLGAPLDAERFTAVDLTGLDRIVDHAAEDLTVTVEAGVTLAALRSTLAARNQWLPLDPLHPEAATVGGMVATGAWGPLRPFGETPRRHLIGISVMDDSGTITRAGGRLVKNVAGYDLMKLHTGALGSLGLIVEMSFRVQPKPETEVLLTAEIGGAAGAAEFAAALRRSDVEPGLFLVHDEDLHVGLLGFREDVARKEVRLGEIAEAAGLVFDARYERADAAERRARLFRAIPDGGVELRLSVLPTRLFALLEKVDAAGLLELHRELHPESGVLRVLAAPPNVPAPPAIAALRRHAEELDGHLVVECAPGVAAPDIDPWGSPGAGAPLMAALKKALDPERRFNPGRVAGGL